MKKRILIIEDEPGIVLTLEDRLVSEGFEVESAGDGISGEALAKTGRFDLILLDIMLPNKDGFQVCQDLRSAGIETPIIMLTARTTNIDTVMGLRLGADDYVSKPFDFQILLARIQANLRRTASQPASPVEDHEYAIGDFVLDTGAHQLKKGDRVIQLNTQEYRLLRFFVEHSGVIFSRDELLNEVWGYDTETTTRTVDVHVAWLRKKLEDLPVPRYLLTIRGSGYKFVP